jgi:hypothetical protein
MAQHDYIISNATFPAVRADINNALSAIQTNNSGTSRPTGAVAGQIWLDTTNSTSPTLKFFDGSDDISLATINYTANTVDWLDSSITITGLSTTATGTVLTLSDSASTSSVNLILDNQKEVRFRETTANGTNYVALKAPASVASDLTFTLPATDGTNGQAIITNGSGVLSFTTLSADGTADWDTSVKTSGFTATANKGYFCNTTSSSFTVTLPSTPSAGDEVILVDYAGTWDTNNLTINPNGGKILAQTSNVKALKDREALRLVYIDTTQGWIPYSGYQESTAGLSLPYSVDFLVIAGGGGGGANYGGGGGAGGYRTSTQSVNSGTVITVTVGGGGVSRDGSGSNLGSNGSDSSISGSGLTTITSTGGGGGNGSSSAGASGGSGGGGGGQGGAGGSGNTPSTSPSQGSNGGAGSSDNGGGGGGAGEAGNTDGTCHGGDGTASSITGSSVTRAGGGGGRTSAGTGGTGGDGGGASGNTSATANTGSGGSGHIGGAVGSPASGVVILSIPTASYSSTTTGSPTVTTSGSNTILQFNGSGSYTG